MRETEGHITTEGLTKLEGYEIRLVGRLTARWACRFEGLSLTHKSDGTTILSGPVSDQAALHGMLRKVKGISACPWYRLTR